MTWSGAWVLPARVRPARGALAWALPVLEAPVRQQARVGPAVGCGVVRAADLAPAAPAVVWAQAPAVVWLRAQVAVVGVVGVRALLVPSAVAERVVALGAANRRSSGNKSLTTSRRPPSAACRCLAAMVPWCAWPGGHR